MTLINRMIKEAKSGANEIVIRPNQVRKVAAHAFRIRNVPPGMGTASLEHMIRLGWIKILGVPIVVKE